MTVDDACKLILQRPCMYKHPPLFYVGGHSFCPCIMEAIRTAYIGGFRHGKSGVEPELGKDAVTESGEDTHSDPPAGAPAPDGDESVGC